MSFHVLPVREGSAAGNMATDLLLLQHWNGPADAVRFRHYGWRNGAFTFGLSQPIAWVRAQLPEGRWDICRRPTGGGIVDHRDDWTYALVIPRGHPLFDAEARASYRSVHEALALALADQRERVDLQAPPEGAAGAHAPTVCFERAEPFDVVRVADGAKIAGAAQKRNKHGLLLQGSIERSRVAADLDWERFAAAFAANLSAASGFGGVVEDAPWPSFPDGVEDALVEHYGSPEWIERR